MKDLRHTEQGNMLFMILIAVALIGLVTAAIQSTSRPDGSNIDKETLIIRTSEVQRYGSELERAVRFIMQNGYSESDIRFAHPDAHVDYGDLSADADPGDQVFHRNGGAASYRAPPPDVNDGSAWEFYAGTDLPQVGSDRADLVAVLPNVTQQFCEAVNDSVDLRTQQPLDTGSGAAGGSSPGDCVHAGAAGRFDDAQQFYDSPSTPNTFDATTFDKLPALTGCVQCEMSAGANDEYHVYHVLLAR